MTIQAACRQGIEALNGFSDAPALDAERLLLHVLGQSESTYLVSHGNDELSSSQEEEFFGFIHKRAGGMPLAYLLGQAEFYGRMFAVTRDVLIPRPATEELIDAARGIVLPLGKRLGRPLVIADIGTGSGCIAITLLLEMPEEISLVVATDISSAALTVARQNAQTYGLEDKIEFLEGDMLTPLHGKQIDLIVSNLPYVPTVELQRPDAIETRGLKYEPQIALDGGLDGLKYVEIIKKSGIPIIAETVGGNIEIHN